MRFTGNNTTTTNQFVFYRRNCSFPKYLEDECELELINSFRKGTIKIMDYMLSSGYASFSKDCSELLSLLEGECEIKNKGLYKNLYLFYIEDKIYRLESVDKNEMCLYSDKLIELLKFRLELMDVNPNIEFRLLTNNILQIKLK